MAEYIEREAALAAINALRGPKVMPKICIKQIPAADVAPVRHGQWAIRYDGQYGQRRLYCLACGSHSGLIKKRPYCPNCGAKMDLR